MAEPIQNRAIQEGAPAAQNPPVGELNGRRVINLGAYLERRGTYFGYIEKPASANSLTLPDLSSYFKSFQAASGINSKALTTCTIILTAGLITHCTEIGILALIIYRVVMTLYYHVTNATHDSTSELGEVYANTYWLLKTHKELGNNGETIPVSRSILQNFLTELESLENSFSDIPSGERQGMILAIRTAIRNNDEVIF